MEDRVAVERGHRARETVAQVTGPHAVWRGALLWSRRGRTPGARCASRTSTPTRGPCRFARDDEPTRPRPDPHTRRRSGPCPHLQGALHPRAGRPIGPARWLRPTCVLLMRARRGSQLARSVRRRGDLESFVAVTAGARRAQRPAASNDARVPAAHERCLGFRRHALERPLRRRRALSDPAASSAHDRATDTTRTRKESRSVPCGRLATRRGRGSAPPRSVTRRQHGSMCGVSPADEERVDREVRPTVRRDGLHSRSRPSWPPPCRTDALRAVVAHTQHASSG